MEMLTKREREVTALVAEGYSNLNISAKLGISEKTVDSHLYNIYRKTACRNRVQLTMWWLHAQRMLQRADALLEDIRNERMRCSECFRSIELLA